jgi:periplasmic copper chaperone A
MSVGRGGRRKIAAMRSFALAMQTPIATIGLWLCASVVCAQSYTFNNLRIEHPYVRPTPPGARTGGAYFAIQNLGAQGDRLLQVATSVAGSAEIHSMTMDGNMMKMRAVTALDVPPHATTALKPNGYHVMLLELKRPLTAGETVPLTLSFEKAGVVEVTARVEAAGSSIEPAPPK